MNKIGDIIYNTTRGIYSVDDKLRIATIFIFCWKLESKVFAELLYTDDHEAFISRLNDKYKDYDVDFNIRLKDKLIKECFALTLKKVIERYDSEGFFKALFNNDEYALAIVSILANNFESVEFNRELNNVETQLKLQL